MPPDQNPACFQMCYASPLWLLLVSLEDGRLLDANGTLLQALGYSRQELAELFLVDLWKIPPDGDTGLMNSLPSLAGLRDMEVRLRDRKGEEHILQAAIDWHCSGEQKHLLFVMSDWTRLHHAETLAAREEQRLASVLRAAPIGIGLVENRVFREANDLLCEMTGYGRQELIGRNARILYPSDQEYEYVGREKYEQIAKSGTGTVETRWKRKDGKMVDILLRSTPLDRFRLDQGVTFTALDITALKSTERQLADSEKRYRSLFWDSPVALWEADLSAVRQSLAVFLPESNGQLRHYFSEHPEFLTGLAAKFRLLDANAAALRLSAASGIEELNVPPAGFFDDSNPESLQNLFLQLAAGQMFHRGEQIIRTRDGRQVPVTMHLRILPGHEQSWERAMISMVDISERRRAEAALQASEAKFRTLFNSSIDAILILDENRIVDCNPAAVKLLECETGRINGESLLSFSPPVQSDGHDSVNRLNRLIQEALQGQPQFFEWQLQLPGGKTVEAEVSLNRFVYGDRILLQTILRDVTERKKMQMALYFTQFAVDYTRDAAYWTDQDGRLIYVNEAACRLLNYTRQELLTMTVHDIDPGFPPEGWADHWSKIRRLKSFLQLSSHQTREGHIFPVEISVNYLAFGGREYNCAFARDITERKRAEEELQEQSQQLESFFTCNLDLLCIADTGGYFHRVNAEWEKTLGYQRQELEGSRFLDFVHPADLERTLEAIISLRQQQTVTGFVNRYRRRDGSYRWLEWRSHPAGDLIYASARDITDHRQSMEALRQSEARFRLVVSNVPLFMFTIDRNGIFTFSDGKGLSAIGLKPGEAVGQSVFGLYREYPEFLGSVHRVLAGEEHHTILEVGGRIFETIFAPLAEPAGGVAGAIGVAVDVTDRQQVQEALQQSESLLHLLMESLPQNIFSKDLAGRFTYVNRHFCQIAGRTREEILGCTDFDLHPAEAARRYRDDDRRVMESVQPLESEEIHYSAGGREVPVQVVKVPLRDSGGNISGILGIFWDISERRRAEQERLEMERRLLHAQKLESLGVLAGGIAHDFNNLLTAILGNLDLAWSDLSPLSSVRPSIEQAMQASRRAADLTRQMLAYSGKGQLLITSVDLSELARENSHLLRASISKTVTLNLNLPEGLPPIQADPGQLQQVIMNLITNASEAIGDRPGIVSLSTGLKHFESEDFNQSRAVEKPPPGWYVWLEVADTGCGMNLDTRQRLFDPFFSTKFTGRGLGMAAVLGIVQGHRGAIFVDSQPASGTTIKVLFPVDEKTIPAAAPSSRPAGLQAAPAISSAGQILIVDDEEMVREVCRRMVEKLGYQTLSAADGEDGLTIFQEHRQTISAVILDLTMPRLDGMATYQAMARIKPEVRVILASGYSQSEVSRRYAGQGLAGFIQKPFRIETLREVLEEALHR